MKSSRASDRAGAFGPGRINLPPMRVLVAPDSFGSTLSASQAAAAIATGWNRTRPLDSFIIAPQSDGGPGFVDVLTRRLGQSRVLRVSGPLGAPIDARWVFDAQSATAYIESAQACGLGALGRPPSPETALDSDSKGVGELIVEALRVGARRIVVGLGGSACTDGGQGLVTVLGGVRAARERLNGVELIAACDVEYPMVGPWGAARVFGPQKGANADVIAELEARLEAWAAALQRVAGRDVSNDPGAGAAGGIGAALLALGGRCESGSSIIAEQTRLADDLTDAGMIVTGEGRFDEQSMHGKVVGYLTSQAKSMQIPLVVLAGQVNMDQSAWRSSGIMSALSLSEYAGSVRLAQADAANQLMGLAAVVAGRLGNSGSSRYR